MSDPEAPSIIYLIGRLDRAVRGRLGEVLAPSELTVAQFTTLSVLARRPGLSNAQLARRALVSPQSMIQILSSLESRELVARRPASGRTLQTTLTAAGRRRLRRAQRAADSLEQEMIAGTPQDAESVMAALQSWTETLAPPRGGRAADVSRVRRGAAPRDARA